MKEENNAPKNKWSDIFRKKWFFPAVYLTIAALLLSVVVWYQNMDNQVPDAQEDSEMSGEYNPRDRKSTRLNSSHVAISYAVFCLKKKKGQPTREGADSQTGRRATRDV